MAAAILLASTASVALAKQQAQVVTGSNCQATAAGPHGDLRFNAYGVRNESADAGAFVICPITLQRADTQHPPLVEIAAFLVSTDGKQRDVTCTAVVGAVNHRALAYSTKTARTPVTPWDDAKLMWFHGDFGGDPQVPDAIPGSAFVTVTCNLPPKTLLNYLTAPYRVDFGS